MLHLLELAAITLAAANALGIGVLVYRRVRLRNAELRRERLELEVTPYALALVDGVSPPDLDTRAQLALADVLSRYARLVRGTARQNIARYFAASSAYDLAVEHLSARQSWRRAEAAFTLGDMGVAAATPALRAALHDREREVRAAAARSLGRLRAVDAAEELAEALATVSVPRQVAATALLQVGDDALPQLLPLLRAPEAHLRATAAELVGLLGSANDAPVLIERLTDASAEVRERAATALGRLGARAAFTELIATLGDRIGFVRAAAAGALGAIGDEAALPLLLELARTDSFEPAHAAAHAVLALDSRAAAATGGSLHIDEIADLARLHA